MSLLGWSTSLYTLMDQPADEGSPNLIHFLHWTLNDKATSTGNISWKSNRQSCKRAIENSTKHPACFSEELGLVMRLSKFCRLIISQKLETLQLPTAN